MNQSWIARSSRSDFPPPSTVYQKTCPTPVASGPSVGTTPAGSRDVTRFMRSRTRVRAKYRSVASSNTTYTIENPNAD